MSASPGVSFLHVRVSGVCFQVFVSSPLKRKEQISLMHIWCLHSMYSINPGLILGNPRFFSNIHSCNLFFEWLMLMQSAAAFIFMARDGTLWRLGKEWRLMDALKASASPAAIYALQNTLLQLSYRHLDSLTFSLLNQTKLVFTALFMFLFLGYVFCTPCSSFWFF